MEVSKAAIDLAEATMRHVEEHGGISKDALALRLDQVLSQRTIQGKLIYPEAAPPPEGSLDHPTVCLVSAKEGDYRIDEDLTVSRMKDGTAEYIYPSEKLPQRVLLAQLEMAHRVLADEATPATNSIIAIGFELSARIDALRRESQDRKAAIYTIISNLHQLSGFSKQAAITLEQSVGD